MSVLNALAIVEATLAEDRWDEDVTSHQISVFLGLKNVDPDYNKSFFIVAKREGTFSGRRWIEAVAQATGVAIDPMCADGDRVLVGHTVCTGRGRWNKILGLERTLLNGLQAFSGIATETHRLVALAAELALKRGLAPDAVPGIYHTRKTPPLTRDFVIEAFLAGGGRRHRADLAERVLVKENHKFLVTEKGHDYSEFARFIVQFKPDALFEVESLAEAEALKAAGAKHLMLDNFSPTEVEAALRALGSGVEIEISGGITAETLGDYLQPGVARISLGAPTHSFRALDLSLDWVADT